MPFLFLHSIRYDLTHTSLSFFKRHATGCQLFLRIDKFSNRDQVTQDVSEYMKIRGFFIIVPPDRPIQGE